MAFRFRTKLQLFSYIHKKTEIFCIFSFGKYANGMINKIIYDLEAWIREPMMKPRRVVYGFG